MEPHADTFIVSALYDSLRFHGFRVEIQTVWLDTLKANISRHGNGGLNVPQGIFLPLFSFLTSLSARPRAGMGIVHNPSEKVDTGSRRSSRQTQREVTTTEW